jgi:protein-histidine pros-kinase
LWLRYRFVCLAALAAALFLLLLVAALLSSWVERICTGQLERRLQDQAGVRAELLVSRLEQRAQLAVAWNQDARLHALMVRLLKARAAPDEGTFRGPHRAFFEFEKELDQAGSGKGAGSVVLVRRDGTVAARARPDSADWRMPPECAAAVAGVAAARIVWCSSLSEWKLPEAEGLGVEAGRDSATTAAMAFAAAPVTAGRQQIGVLAVRMWPERTIRLGLHDRPASGSRETAVFDASGRAQVEGRRPGWLEWVTLKEPGGSGLILPVRESLVSGGGVDAGGFSDDLGRRSVAAWRWLSEYGLGVLYREDYESAWAPARGIHALIGTLIAITVACVVIAVWVVRQERQRARDLAESTARLRTMIESAPFGLALSDHEGRCVYANRVLQEQSGRSEEELLGRGSELIVHPEERATVISEWRAAILDRKSYQKLIRIQRPDGRTLRTQVRAEAMLAGDVHLGWVMTVEDLTPQLDALDALRVKEERLAHALDSAEMGTWDWDVPAGRIHICRRMAAWLGVEDRYLARSEVRERVHPDDRAERDAALEPVLAGESNAFVYQVRMQVAGRWRWFQWNGRVVETRPDGGPLRLIGTLADIQHSRELEEELWKALHRAEEASVAKSRFLANMSHEIRTPLNGVMGMAALLGETELSSEQKEYLRALSFSADALLSVLNDVLDFSKIEAGKLRIEAVRTPLVSLLGDCVEVLAGTAARKGLELAALVDPGVPDYARLDPVRLRQVLLNLLSNGIKFTERGSVAVRCWFEAEPGGGGLLKLAVEDTGIGIEEGALAHIFNPFEQADSSMTRRFGGTGLGLTITRQLVELMGGSIQVSSRVGKGSEFRFSVKVEEPEFEPEPCCPEVALVAVEPQRLSREALALILRRSKLSGTVHCDLDSAREALLRSRSARKFLLCDYRLYEPSPEDPAVVLIAPLTERHLASRHGLPVLTRPMRLGALTSLIQERLLRPEHGTEVPESGRGRPAGAARSVLLAEDHPVNQTITKRLLEKRGWKVEVAQSGKEAVEMCRRRDFDVLLIDCQMPEMDGFEAARQIRNLDSAVRDAPILAFTASATVESRERCAEAGMDDFLPKPLRPEELFEKLESWTSAPRGQSAPRPREATMTES